MPRNLCKPGLIKWCILWNLPLKLSGNKKDRAIHPSAVWTWTNPVTFLGS
jgi:hypothetical protein